MDEKKYKLAMLLCDLHEKSVKINQVRREGLDILKKFMALYGDINLDKGGVPHTITVMLDDGINVECVQKQIDFLVYDEKEDTFIFYCTDGSFHTSKDAHFDDLAYLFADLDEEMLKYMEDREYE